MSGRRIAAWLGILLLAGCGAPRPGGWLAASRFGEGARWQMRTPDGRLWTVAVRGGDLGLSIDDASLWLVGADPGSGVPFDVLDLGEPWFRFQLPGGREAEWRRDVLALGELRFRLAPGSPPPAVDVRAATDDPVSDAEAPVVDEPAPADRR